MAVETVTIPTRTIINVSGTDIGITVEYFPEGQFLLMFFSGNRDQTIEGVSVRAGDLGYTYENITDLFEINTNGDFIVNAIDPTVYNIDANGDLIRTT